MITPYDFLHRYKKKIFMMIRSRSEKNSGIWFLKCQFFQQRYKLKLEFPGMGWGKAKKSSAGKYGYFLE